MAQSSLVCHAPACQHVAAQILSSLSPNYLNIDPCTDFAEYACGGWPDTHPISRGESVNTDLGWMDYKVEKTMRNILTSEYPSAQDPRNWVTHSIEDAEDIEADKHNFNKLVEFYSTCMNKTQIRAEGIQVLQDLVSRSTHSYSDTIATKSTAEELYRLESLGVDSLYTLTVQADDADPNTQRVYAGPLQTDYNMPRSIYSGFRDEYQQVIANLLLAVSSTDHVVKSANQLANAIIDIEDGVLKAAHAAQKEVYDKSAKLTLAEAAKIVPELHVEHVIPKLSPKGYTVDEIFFSPSDYFRKVSLILHDKPPTTLEAFFQWRIISHYSQSVDATPLHAFADLKQKASDRNAVARFRSSSQCISELQGGGENPNGGLALTLGRFYIEKSYSQGARKQVEDMIVKLKSALIHRVEKMDWLAISDRNRAVEKVNSITSKVGWSSMSPNILAPQEMQEYYENLNITGSYLSNIAEVNRFQVSQLWAGLGKPTNRNAWIIDSTSVNAAYNPQWNGIFIAAGIQTFPIYELGVPNYALYGALGSICAHEMTHSLDKIGRMFDAYGQEGQWLHGSSVAAFTNLTTCFVEQFNNYTVQSANGSAVHVDGKLTLAENMADSGGLNIAYQAWQLARQSDKDLSLPELGSFTHEQLFFLRYAGSFCSNSKPGAFADALSDPHSPPPIRILGAVANSAAFREAFQCPVRQPKCELW